MSTAPVFVVHDGNVEATERAQNKLGLADGTRLVLVRADDREVVFRPEQPIYRGMTIDEYMAGWQSMLGVMPDGKDTTEERARDRAFEAARERQKFGD